MFCLGFFVLRVVNCSGHDLGGYVFPLKPRKCERWDVPKFVHWWVKQMSSAQQRPGKYCGNKGWKTTQEYGGYFRRDEIMIRSWTNRGFMECHVRVLSLFFSNNSTFPQFTSANPNLFPPKRWRFSFEDFIWGKTLQECRDGERWIFKSLGVGIDLKFTDFGTCLP